MRMALMHDLSETLVGDVMPAEGISRSEKKLRETQALKFISQQLLGSIRGGSSLAAELCDTWEEFEASQTLESRYIQDLDKLEMLLQLVEYEKQGAGILKMDEFEYAASNICLPEMKEHSKLILAEREDFWAQKSAPVEISVQVDRALRGKQDEYYSFGRRRQADLVQMQRRRLKIEAVRHIFQVQPTEVSLPSLVGYVSRACPVGDEYLM